MFGHHFFCVFLFSIVIQIHAETLADCPPLWLRYNRACYWASDFAVPGKYVESACPATHPSALPVSIHSQFENVILDSLLNGTAAWMGLSRPGNSSAFTWSDGSDLDFTYWNQNQPSNDGDCGIVNDNKETGQWAAVNCNQEHIFTCEIHLATCPEGWSLLNDTCYVFNNEGSSAKNLSIACRAMHPDALPVSIHSREVNSFLFLMIPDSYNTWIGLTRPEDSGSWRWPDGTVMDYENWSYGDPTPHTNYAYMYLDHGTWGTTSYGDSSISYFCELKLLGSRPLV